jgi:glycosyltransferase involved in cell wall biosynthesis
MAVKYSIVIPAYNRPHMLRQAISSCLRQTTEDFEVLISDDCSEDSLDLIANGFCDSRIRYLRSPNRLGAVRNHRYGVENSVGQYVKILHSDDILLPNCLELAGAALEANCSAAAVYFACIYVIGDSIVGVSRIPRLCYANRYTFVHNQWLDKLPGVGPTCCLFRRSSYQQVGGYLPELSLAYDWEIYMKFMRNSGGVIFLPEILCGYRQHDGQVTHSSSREGLYDMLNLWQKEEYSYFSKNEMLELIITEFAKSVNGISNCMELIRGIVKRGPVGRILAGLPVALVRRVSRRLIRSLSLSGRPIEGAAENDFVIPTTPWTDMLIWDGDPVDEAR